MYQYFRTAITLCQLSNLLFCLLAESYFGRSIVFEIFHII
jgi:hypothetical protein